MLIMRYTDDIVAFLGAFPIDEVSAALAVLKDRDASSAAQAGEWTHWNSDTPPAPPFEWRRLPNGDLQYRDPVALVAPERAAKSSPSRRFGPKVDTSLQRAPGISCPWCGGETFREPLCPRCKEWRAGMAARIICGDNSDHVFYVPREE